jgi:hypothetical protein
VPTRGADAKPGCSAQSFGRLAGRLGCGSRGGLRDDLIPMVIAAHGVAEIPEPAPQRAPHLGKPLRTQYEQRDDKDKQQMCWLKDVADHSWVG